jgi:DNA-binding NarL/FixJ family response regulator
MTHEASAKPVVLVVDDAPDTLSMLSALLETAGMTALVAADGQAAVALLEHIVPDIILMDAVMPRLDGFQTTNAIKGIEKFAHIPIIFMTGLSDTESVVRGFEAGGVDYITKPIVPEETLARVRVHIANSRLAQSARQALDLSGTPLISARANGDVLWITPEGLKLFGDDGPNRGELAPHLVEIIAGKTTNVVLAETAEGPAFASFIGQTGPGEYLIRLKVANALDETAILREKLALTDREAEVLSWIAKGKSNRDIAEILDCSPRTVNKHLEQIYHKLQVENRTSAATRAIRVLSEH